MPLHPALEHHLVNTLGWRSLRPLQEQAIEPILSGANALLLAGTAAGKTEAAVFPVLSRILSEDWRGLSVVYVCPIKALLNNLEPRLTHYAELVGRRVALWHGDVGAGARKRIVSEPPDLLLTTPESLEAMLLFRREERGQLFSRLQVVVVDELHAFAGDDRGWHLLAVVERLARVAGRDLQRLGLSATLGNPNELLAWLSSGSQRPQRVVAPAAVPGPTPEVVLDHVGSLGNAATVIARLHRGEKRLVFCDSRTRVEDLAAALRALEVKTYVSHGSLGLDERRQAETAFREAQDCVIVATATLELGLDVGDLDRVIQIDAPRTVAGFLQRLGRTGRRADTNRNCLFLTTRDDAFLRAAAIVWRWSQGWVEPVVPPPLPWHVLAHQLLALTLQEGTLGRQTWAEWLPAFLQGAHLDAQQAQRLLDHMVAVEMLAADGELLVHGPAAEKAWGRRNWMELCAVFQTPPLFAVFHGRKELGLVGEQTFLLPGGVTPILLLGGRSWEVGAIDWRRRTVQVTPSESKGRSIWQGTSGAMSYHLTQAIPELLVSETFPARLTQRGVEQMTALREELSWVQPGTTSVVQESGGRCHWWTFAGLRANAQLARLLGGLADPGVRGSVTDFRIRLAVTEELETKLEKTLAQPASPGSSLPADEREIGDLLSGIKFSACLDSTASRQLLEQRLEDTRGVEATQATPMKWITTHEAS